MWDLLGTPSQNGIIEAALARCDFPWDRLRTRLQRVNRERIPVEWADLSRYAAQLTANKGGHAHIHEDGDTADPLELRHAVLGLAWYSGKVTIEQSLESSPSLAQEVFMAEAAHMVDFFYLTEEQRHAIYAEYHGSQPADDHGHGWFDQGGYEDWVGESWMAGFTVAFSDIRPSLSGMTHETVPAHREAFRRIVLGEEERPFRVFSLRRSRVFHDRHAGIAAEVVYDSPEQAIGDGRRACGVCKP